MTDEISNYYKPHTIQMIVIGNSHVGKTSMMIRYTTNTAFNPKIQSTIGIEYFSKTVQYKNKKYYLNIHDTAGQERFRSMLPMYFQNISIVIGVYDLSQLKSLDDLFEFWLPFCETHCSENTQYYIFGTKKDLIEQNEDNQLKIVEEKIKKNLQQTKFDIKHHSIGSSKVEQDKGINKFMTEIIKKTHEKYGSKIINKSQGQNPPIKLKSLQKTQSQAQSSKNSKKEKKKKCC